MSSYKIVSFSKKDFESFKKEIQKAAKEGKEFITFNGDEYLVSYAKYLIEFYQPKFDKMK